MGKNIKLLILFITIFVSGNLYSEETEKQILKIGVYNNPPKISVTEDGKVSGYHIDLLNSIFSNSPYRIKYVTGTWAEGLSRLGKGEINIMPDVAWSPERALLYDFNNEYVLLNWACVYSSKDVPVDIMTDLDEKRVAVMKGSIHTEGASGIMKQAENYSIKCNFIFVSSYSEAFKLTDSGDADAAVVNRLFGLLNEDRYRVKRTGIIFNPSQIKYAFRKNDRKNGELIVFLDSRLMKLKADKESVYYSTFKKYLQPEIAKEKLLPAWSLKIIILAIILSIIMGLYILSARSGKRESRILKDFFRHHVSMRDIRLKITDSSIIAFALFSVPLFLSILYHGLTIGWNNIILFYLLPMAVAVFTAISRKKISVQIKLSLILACMFCTGILVLISWGRIGTGLTFFLTSGIIITLSYGKRAGLAVILSGLVVTIIFGILTQYRIILYDYDMVAYSQSPSSWTFAVMVIFILFFTIISGIEQFYENLVTAVENLEQKVRERTTELDNVNRSLHKEIDIRTKVEEELIIAKLQAEQASKAKGVFLASMTHEIRTPLNAILGYSQILMREKSLPGESLKQIETINSSGEHLLELINDILDMSKIEEGRIDVSNETFSLFSVMEQIENMFSVKTGRKGLGFKIVISDNVPDIIETDKSKLRQVLINLIGNAIKFTDNGSVRVEVSAPDDEPELLAISVFDTGKGIPADFLEHIFDPFEQTAEGRDRGGTGLGLPISRKFAAMLGGDITIRSTVNQGSCFTFTMKYRKGDGAVIEKAEPERRIVGIKNGIIPKVLVVDDRDENRDILVRILAPLGFTLKEASGGREALELAAGWEPDLILLDLIMPEINGRDVIISLKENPQHSGIKIIVITASALEMEKDEILALGADSFIRKPFREISVLNEIRNIFGLEYNYDNETDRDKTVPSYTSDKELAERLSRIPEEIRKELINALITGDIKEIKNSIQKVETLDMELAEQIQYMADDFEFSSLLEILKKA